MKDVTRWDEQAADAGDAARRHREEHDPAPAPPVHGGRAHRVGRQLDGRRDEEAEEGADAEVGRVEGEAVVDDGVDHPREDDDEEVATRLGVVQQQREHAGVVAAARGAACFVRQQFGRILHWASLWLTYDLYHRISYLSGHSADKVLWDLLAVPARDALHDRLDLVDAAVAEQPARALGNDPPVTYWPRRGWNSN